MGQVVINTVEGAITVPAGGSATFHFLIPMGGGDPNAGSIGTTALNADILAETTPVGGTSPSGYYQIFLTDPAGVTVTLTHNAGTNGTLIPGLSAAYGVGGTAICVVDTTHVIGNYVDMTFHPILYIYFANNVTVPTPVQGCTNPAATNYNPLATVDDGSCILPVRGCTNPAATNYNPLATVDDGSCVFPVVTAGCTDPRATNYNPTATVDNGSCVLPALPVRGCTDPTAINYNSLAAQSDGSCLYAVPVPTTTPPFVAICPCLWTATLLPIKDWAIVVPPVGTWIQKPC